jgi:hypothetical protein
MTHLLRTHIEAISPLSDDEFNYILGHFTSRKLKKHAFLVQEGNELAGVDGIILNDKNELAVISNKSSRVLQLKTSDRWATARVVKSKGSVLPFPTTGVLRNGKYYVLNGKLAELFDPKAEKTSNFLLQEIAF